MPGAASLAGRETAAASLRRDLQVRGIASRRGIRLPERLDIEGPCSLSDVAAYESLRVGAYTYLGEGCELRGVTIGRFCSIARRVVIGPREHPTDMLSTHPVANGGGSAFASDPYFRAVRQPVVRRAKSGARIGHDVWIGDGVFVRRGVTVGDGAVIGARSVVLADVPPYAIVAGTPARLIRMRFDRRTVERLGAVRWWELDMSGIELDFGAVDHALGVLEALPARRPLPVERLTVGFEGQGRSELRHAGG